MDIIFDPINSLITLSLKSFDYDTVKNYVESKGFFFPIVTNSLEMFHGKHVSTFKGQSPLSFIYSVHIKQDNSSKEIGKRILKSSSGYRIAPVYLFDGLNHLVEYVSVRLYSHEIVQTFHDITVNLSNIDISIIDAVKKHSTSHDGEVLL